MKKSILLSALFATVVGTTTAQTTAPNFTATDCNGQSHTLYSELDSNNVVVLVWVMPCGSCIPGAKAAYNAVQSFSAAHPGRVRLYIADDLGDQNCNDINTWIASNAIGSNITTFGNSGNVINENGFGGTGMPHVVVMAGSDHKIYYNKKNNATNDQAGITTAISSALASLNVPQVEQQVFSISPNPVTDILTIKYARPVSHVQILSLSGQVVREHSYGKGAINPAFDMTGLASGNYIIKLTDATGKTGTQQIVKE